MVPRAVLRFALLGQIARLPDCQLGRQIARLDLSPPRQQVGVGRSERACSCLLDIHVAPTLHVSPTLPFAAILRNCQIARLNVGWAASCGVPQRMLWAMVANSIHCRGTCSVLQQPNQHPVLSPHSCPNPPTPDCQIASARLPDWTAPCMHGCHGPIAWMT